MQHKIMGQLRLPDNPKQKALHQSAGQFLRSLQRRKDTAEVLRDQRNSSPPTLLPMVF